MANWTKQAILCVLLSAFLYIWITKPLPGFKDGWQLKVISIGMTIDGFILHMYDYGVINLGSFVVMKRQTLDFLGVLNPHPRPTFKERMIRDVKTYIFSPDAQEQEEVGNGNARQLPAIVYYHGGGFLIGIQGPHHSHCEDLSKKIGGVVISVDYSLSPEVKIPTAHDECLTVTKHILDNPEEFGIDPNRVVLMGDSVGGLVATSVSYRLAKEQERKHQPKFQMLMHPVLQVFSTWTASHKNAMRRPMVVTKRNMCSYASAFLTGTLDYLDAICNDSHTEHLKDTVFASYLKYAPADTYKQMKLSDVISPVLPRESLHGLLSPDYFPLMSDDLSRIPRTFIVTSEHDGLKDDGWLFAHRLEKSGVKVAHKHYDSFHVSHLLCYSPLCTKSGAETLGDILSFLSENI